MSTKRKREEFRLPETIVLAINTHGYIMLDEYTHEPEFFTPPEGVEVVKIAAVVPGVCNILSPEAVTQNIKIIDNAIKPYKSLDDVNLYDLGNTLSIKLMENQIDLPEIETDYRQSLKRIEPAEIDAVTSSHIHASDKGFQVEDYSGKRMINKGYMRTRNDPKQKHHDWKMIIVNRMGAKIDFLPTVARILRSEEPYTDISTIIQDLQRFGAKRVLIVDFSCSNFVNSDRGDIVNARGERNVRNELLKKGLFGGKTRKRKSRKHNRRNTRLRRYI